MARKRKNEPSLTETSIEVEHVMSEVVKGPKVSLSYWTDKKVKEGKIRSHQLPALSVFLKKQGLSDSESADDFNLAFARF